MKQLTLCMADVITVIAWPSQILNPKLLSTTFGVQVESSVGVAVFRLFSGVRYCKIYAHRVCLSVHGVLYVNVAHCQFS